MAIQHHTSKSLRMWAEGRSQSAAMKVDRGRVEGKSAFMSRCKLYSYTFHSWWYCCWLVGWLGISGLAGLLFVVVIDRHFCSHKSLKLPPNARIEIESGALNRLNTLEFSGARAANGNGNGERQCKEEIVFRGEFTYQWSPAGWFILDSTHEAHWNWEATGLRRQAGNYGISVGIRRELSLLLPPPSPLWFT